MDNRVIEKWECHDYDDCGGSFLVDQDRAKGRKLKCPFCGVSTEAVTSTDPETSQDFIDEFGCLYPK